MVNDNYKIVAPVHQEDAENQTSPTWFTVLTNQEDEERNYSFVAFEKLNHSEFQIPVVNFTNHPVKAAMDETIKWISVCIIIEVMLGLGCSVDLNALKNHIKRPYGVGIASASQFILMPLLVFGGVKLLEISHVPAVVVLVTASVPGGILSNILAYLIEGDIALSITMSICSSLLAFAFIPFNLFVYGSQWLPQDINYRQLIAYPAVLLSLLIMFVPVSVGIIISWRWPGFAKQITTVCKALLIATTLGLVVLAALVYEDMLLRHLPMEMWIICTVMPLFGFTFGYISAALAKLNDQTRRTVAVETMCQNGLLGCAILKVAFPSHLIGSFFVFPLLYSAFQFVEGLLFVAIFRYKKKLENEKNKVHDFSSLGGVPVHRIRRVSLYVIDRMRRRFSSDDRSNKSSVGEASKSPGLPEANRRYSADVRDVEEDKPRTSNSSYSNNVIKTAIAEEREARGVIASFLNNDKIDLNDVNDVTRKASPQEDESLAPAVTSSHIDVESLPNDSNVQSDIDDGDDDDDDDVDDDDVDDDDDDDDDILIYSTGSSIKE